MDRKPKDLILEDRLLLSEPALVSDWLVKANSVDNDLSSFGRDYDTEIEMSLLKRGDPLITLALAQFGTNVDMLKLIWAKSEDSPDKLTGHTRALRLAILSNQSVGEIFSFGAPAHISIIGLDKFTDFLVNASKEEIDSLGKNPRVAFLEALYEKTGAFEALTDDRWREVIAATVGNSRLSERYDSSGDTDGYGEFKHNSVFSAIYALPTKVAVTREWAATLYWLLERALPYLPYKTTLDDIETTMARWRVPLFEKPAEATFHIDPCAYLRTYYGRLYFSYGIKKPIDAITVSDDMATRCAAYAWGELTPDQVKLGAEKDKSDFLSWACSNTNLCRTQALREALREAVRNFGDEDGYDGHRFLTICAEQHKDHPSWFNDDPYKEDMEEDERLASDQPVAQPSPELLTLIGKVDTIASKVETIYAIAIITGIAVLWRVFFH
jgi:hypothetical protein